MTTILAPVAPDYALREIDLDLYLSVYGDLIEHHRARGLASPALDLAALRDMPAALAEALAGHDGAIH